MYAFQKLVLYYRRLDAESMWYVQNMQNYTSSWHQQSSRCDTSSMYNENKLIDT